MTAPGPDGRLTCLAGGTVLAFDDDGTVFERGEVWLRGGEILAAGAPGVFRPEAGADVDRVDVSGRLVVPGFINAHSHSYSALLKGSVEKEPLDLYMLQVIAAGDAMTPREIYVAAQLDALTMLKRGMTSVIDHYSERPAPTRDGLAAVRAAFEDVGIRATVAPMFSDLPYIETIPLDPAALPPDVRDWYARLPRPDPARYFEIVEAAARDGTADDRVRVILGVDGPQRCSEALVRMTAEFQQGRRLPLHTHMMETKTQAAMRPDGGFARRLADLGILDDRSSLVHFVWTDGDDIAAVRDVGATVVHCPQSNAMLGAGICPVLRLRGAGVPVAFGTDGSNCGPASYLENLRLGAWLMRLGEPDPEKWPGAETLLRDAYRAGARAAGAPGAGRIAAGARADLAVLDPSGHWHQPMGEVHRHLLYYESGESVESVWVDGRQVVRGGRSTTVDEDALVDEAAGIAARRRGGASGEAEARIAAQYPAFRDMILRELAAETGIERRVALR